MNHEEMINEAVRSALAMSGVAVHCLAVRRKPKSGKPVSTLPSSVLTLV